MKLSDNDVRWCFEQVDRVVEQYELYVYQAKFRPRSADDLLWVVKQYVNCDIRMLELDIPYTPTDAVPAMTWEMADGSYDIFVKGGLGHEQTRYVRCKELFHVVLKDEAARSQGTYAHLEGARVSVLIGDHAPDKAVASEWLAELAAMEFLFPYAERLQLVTENGEPDYARIAQAYQLPQNDVESHASGIMLSELSQVRGDPDRDEDQ